MELNNNDSTEETLERDIRNLPGGRVIVTLFGPTPLVHGDVVIWTKRMLNTNLFKEERKLNLGENVSLYEFSYKPPLSGIKYQITPEGDLV